jgi:O-antigen/teichoic acid export membrane protein
MLTPLNQFKDQVLEVAQMLFNKGESESLERFIFSGATGTFALNVAFTGMLFITSILLARILGSSGYGAYAYALSWIALLAVPADLGSSRLVVRNVAAYQSKSNWDLLTGLLRWTNRAVFFTSLVIALLSGLVTFSLRRHLNPQMLSAFWMALLLLPVLCVTRVKKATILGFNHIVLAQVPEMLLQPILFIFLIVAVYLVAEGSLTATGTLGLNVLATGAALLLSILLLRKILPQPAEDASPRYETRAWVISSVSMVFVAGMSVINSRADILMLGAMKGAEAVGVYNIAVRGAELFNFVLIPLHQTIGPTVASFYATKDFQRLQHLITKITHVIVLLSLPILAGLILFGYWFLLIFGPDFTRGKLALVILSLGHMTAIAMGPVALLLIMTGHERDAAKSVGICALLNVALNASYIPIWGIEGAAFATATSNVLSSLLMLRFVYKKLGIQPTVLGKISLRKAI